MIKVIAPAKVNLHLGVGGVRPDGYHDLTGVFHTLELADELTLEKADAFQFECDVDLGLPDERNLAHAAVLRLAKAMGRTPDVTVSLKKRIPHGAGLGGGSSDAAAMLAGLAMMWGLDSTDTRIVDVARTLGADVAFFLEPGGAALMAGRGDVIVRSLPALAGAPAVLVRPPMPVSTAAAYAAFDTEPVESRDPGDVVAALLSSDVAALARALTNNLERASASVVPEVADALAWTRSADGVLGAVVAGSGSAVFALVESYAIARRISEDARAKGWWGAATRLANHGAHPRYEG